MDVRRQKRERDSDFSSPLEVEGMFSMENNDSKKAKTDGAGPSRVLHVRNIVAGVTEQEVIQLCMPFGKVTNLLMMKAKNQAFVEFEQESSAQTMVNYFNRSAQPMLGGRPVFVQYSQHREIKTDNAHSLANEKAQAALAACQNGGGMGMMDSTGDYGTGQESVLHVTIENMVYPVTLETLAIIFKKYGPVDKILTFTKNNKFQALIQYPNRSCSEEAKYNLHGQNVYNGCCNLRVESSKISSVNVKYNNDRAWDFTNPNLPSGENGAASNRPAPGSDAGMGNGGMLGGYSQSSSMGMGGGLGSGMSGMGGMGDYGSGMGSGMGMGGGMGGGMAVSMGSGMRGGMSMGSSAMMAGSAPSSGSPVLLVSNLEENSITVDNLFTLFGVYGDVQRVKILYNKKDTALIQMSDPWMADIARQHLDKLVVWGKPMQVRTSKHTNVSMPRDDPTQQQGLTKDFSNSPLHRYKKAGSKNCSNIYKPGPTLHLSNIGEGCGQDELVAHFREYGTVHQFKFFNETQKMALLSMDSTEEAVLALIGMHNKQFGKQHLRVSFSKSQLGG